MAAQYTAAAEVTFALGKTAHTLSVATENDTVDEALSGEPGVAGRITAALQAGAGYTAVADSSSAEIAVEDDDAPDWSVAVSPAEIGEAGGTATLTVSTGGATFADSQTLSLTTSGTATADDDYTLSGGTQTPSSYELTLSAGATSAAVEIAAVADSTAESDETLTLAARHDSVEIGTATLTITDGICGRTGKVRDAILGRLSGVSDCAAVTALQLSNITGTLDLAKMTIRELKAGDFAGLGALEELDLKKIKLNSLPAGIFDDLTALTTLRLQQNALTDLPAGLFAGLTELTDLQLDGNQMAGLESGDFAGLSKLETLDLEGNQLSTIQTGAFDGLTALTMLRLQNNRLADMPAGLFDDLSQLTELNLRSNQFQSLPDGVFSGLAAVTTLKIDRNPTDPLPLTVGLEKVGENQFKAVVPAGATFALELAVSVTSGTIGGNASATVTIPRGALESGALAVARTAGTTDAVTVNIGALPDDQPGTHVGYALRKAADLPLEILAETPVVAIEALSAQASESAGAVFTLTRTGSAGEPLTVTVNVTEEGDVLQTPSVDGSTIVETVTFAEHMPTAALTVATDDDALDEELTAGSSLAGRITAAVQSGTGYALDTGGNASATVDIEDNDPAAPVTPPAAEALVGNLDQAYSGGLVVHDSQTVSQGLTTGSNAAGFEGFALTSVEVRLGVLPNSAYALSVSVHESNGSGGRGALLHTLTNPASFVAGVNTFTAPEGAVLDAGTEYFVVFQYTGPSGNPVQVDRTGSTAQQGASGWSIADQAGVIVGSVILMRINGYEQEAPGAVLSVADAQVQEAQGAMLDFEVTLNRSSASTVHVDYRTVDGTAKAGEDYVAQTATLTFAPGETAKTVSVAVLDDMIDDTQETMTLLLFDAAGAGVERGQATGTINNSDPLPQAWLVRFGRTVASHVAEGISERLMRTERVRPHATVAGLRLPFGELDSPSQELRNPGYGALPWDPEAEDGLTRTSASSSAGMQDAPLGRSRGLTSRDLLLGTSFLIRLGGKDDQGALSGWTLWGRGMATRFDGSEDQLKLNGDVTTYMLGADTAWDRWLAGVALARSRGGGGYDANLGDRAERGELTSKLTSVHPYVRFTLSERMTAWGSLGYGRGELTLNRGAAGVWDTDTSMTMAALGARGVLSPGAYTGGFELAVRSDALYTRMTSGASDNKSGRLAGSEGNAGRLRLILEGSRTLSIGGRTLTPNLELGLRHDAGDAETGTGIEIGGGLNFSDPTLGLSVEVKARGLIAHQDADYREWGASAAVRLNPGASGQGLMLTLRPTWGNAASGIQQLASQRNARGLIGHNSLAPGSRVDAEVGYALNGPKGLGTHTPYAAISLGDTGDRTLRVGWRLAMGPQGRLDLEAMRRQTGNANAADNGILMRAAVRW